MESILFQLHKMDPKPENPLQFVRQQIAGPLAGAIADEAKEIIDKLVDEINILKAEVTHIKKRLNGPIAKAPISNGLLACNVSNGTQTPRLNESSTICEETLQNSAITDATVQSNGSSSSTTQSSHEITADSVHGYTVEIVEVKVIFIRIV